jgi:putative radical SAM enzyme (TIGR03279 family)
MPPGCRPSLYIRDDDYRASFLHGNYITLGTLNQPDRERIFAQRLSPLYISVHTTEPALRSFMLGNRKAPDILSGLKKLALGGIRFHAQIVLCPGINDGARLEKTLDELSGLFPAVISIAVVPVGLTAHRKGLYRLAPYTRAGARGVLRIVDRYAVLFRKSHGTRLVFASDEFYVKAGVQVPGARSYEDFPQIENGVGMAADFLREVKGTRVPSRIAPIRVTVATGVSFGRILKRALAGLERVRNARVRTIIVQNRFFGPSVTVSGLLTGSDIAQGLKNKRLGDLVLVPANSLKEDEPVFLDNMTLNQLQKILKRPVRPVAGFKDLIAILKKGA